MTINKELIIGVVGPCSAGKSTLVRGLERRGFQNARNIAQEHSYTPNMWERISNPDILIFLDVSYSVAQARRKLNWNLSEYETQKHRLRDARQHADFYLDTNPLSPPEVLSKVLSFFDTLLN